MERWRISFLESKSQRPLPRSKPSAYFHVHLSSRSARQSREGQTRDGSPFVAFVRHHHQLGVVLRAFDRRFQRVQHVHSIQQLQRTKRQYRRDLRAVHEERRNELEGVWRSGSVGSSETEKARRHRAEIERQEDGRYPERSRRASYDELVSPITSSRSENQRRLGALTHPISLIPRLVLG